MAYENLNPKRILLAAAVLLLSVSTAAMAHAQTTAITPPSDAEVGSAIAAVQAVDVNGTGHTDAVAAMKVLNRISVDQVPLLFEALEGCNAISANWIRAAAQKAISNAEDLPLEKIKSYFEDQSNDSLGRWLAYQVLVDKSEGFRDATIDSLATDSSMPLREIGIERLLSDLRQMEIADGDADAKSAKLAAIESALDSARDVDQIIEIAKLASSLEKEINLRQHLGFLSQWKLVAGFDNKNEAGFDVVYGPEKNLNGIDLSASASFPIGDENVSWIETTTEHETGIVNLNELLGKQKGVVAYAVTTFNSPLAGPAEIRIGTWNAHKIWINGELVMSNEIYHNSSSIDKFTAPISLTKGANQIVMKLCQNEQTEQWAQEWSFQVRICDETGKALAAGN